MDDTTPFEKFKTYFLALPPVQQAGFFLWPSLASDSLMGEEILLLQKIKPSGLIFFKRNLTSTQQAQTLVTEIKNLIENKKDPFFKPFILSIDEEGGRVSRLPPPHMRGKSALEFAHHNDKEGLIEQVNLQCASAHNIGINCLLAPVADILTEPQNPVMGDRCFGYDAQNVSEFATLVNRTIRSQKLFSCAKHFPGHGNTLTDSHKEVSVSNASLSQLKTREWLPFKALIAGNIPFIMAAHVLLPQVDPFNPATLSHKILTEQLQNELGFKGLILSDDLRMNAIALHYKVTKQQESSIIEEDLSQNTSPTISSQQEDSYLELACIDALNAGCDILLSCQSIVCEEIIANTIAKKLGQDKEFLEKMTEKAWKIYSVLNL